jgi:hypothetical protein
MQKSIVLLITLFFITTISILILQNLKDTDDFLNELAFDNSLSQIQITIDNIQKEIPKYLNKNKNNIDAILENFELIPLFYGNINIVLNIVEYTLGEFNINKLTIKNTSSDKFMNNIINIYDFVQLVNKHKPYSSKDQILETINEYIELTHDKDILNIKDDFTYFSVKKGVKLIECTYTLDVDNIESEVSFVFDLNTTSIKDFKIKNLF